MTPREKLKRKLDQMTDTQIDVFLRLADLIQPEPTPEALPADYDPDNDPLVGFLSGPVDLAERTEESCEMP